MLVVSMVNIFSLPYFILTWLTYFNRLVAVTRAQALLIVIGNPHFLSLDPLWREFLNYVHLKRGWRGVKMSWDPNAPVDGAAEYADATRRRAEADVADRLARLRAMIMTRNADEDGGEYLSDDGDSDYDGHPDRPGILREDE